MYQVRDSDQILKLTRRTLSQFPFGSARETSSASEGPLPQSIKYLQSRWLRQARIEPQPPPIKELLRIPRADPTGDLTSRFRTIVDFMGTTKKSTFNMYVYLFTLSSPPQTKLYTQMGEKLLVQRRGSSHSDVGKAAFKSGLMMTSVTSVIEPNISTMGGSPFLKEDELKPEDETGPSVPPAPGWSGRAPRLIRGETF